MCHLVLHLTPLLVNRRLLLRYIQKTLLLQSQNGRIHIATRTEQLSMV